MPNTLEELEIVVRANIEDAITKLEEIKTRMKENIEDTMQKMQPSIQNVNKTFESTSNVVANSTSKSAKQLEIVNKQIDIQKRKIKELQKQMQKYNSYNKMQAKLSSGKLGPQEYMDLYSKYVGQSVPKDVSLQLDKAQIELDKLNLRSDDIKNKLLSIKQPIKEVENNVKQAMNKVSSETSKATKHTNRLLMTFKRLSLAMLVRNTIRQAIAGFQDLAKASNEFNSTMSNIQGSMLQARNSITTALAPALQVIEPIIVRIAEAISSLFTKIAMYTSALAGNNFYYKATKLSTNYAVSLGKVAKEQNKVLAGFDELNVLSDKATASNGFTGIPSAEDMFVKEPIPEDVLKNAEKLKDIYEKLKPVLEALGVLWAADKLGVTDWIKKLFGADKATKNLTKSMLEKNSALGDQTEETQEEMEALKSLVPQLAFAKDGVWALDKELQDLKNNKLEMPELEPVYAFQNAFQTAQENVSKSMEIASYDVGQNAINIENALSEMKTNVEFNTGELSNVVQADFDGMTSSTKTSFKDWCKNVAKNAYTTFYNLAENTAQGLDLMQTNAKNFIVSSSKGFVSWGQNVMETGRKSIKNFVETFVSGLEMAWNSFRDFMSATGEKIGNWWKANKNWALPTAVALTVVGGIALAPMTGGASLLPALASGGVLSKPTPILAGEYPSAKSNPEIVAPQSLMYETNMKANVPVMNSIEELGDRLLEALNSLSVYAEFDYDKLRVGLDNENYRAGEKLYGV